MADNLTVDYKKLLKLTVAQRVDMARSQLGQTYLSSLTPSQYAALFPDYYKKFVPSYSSLGGGGGGAGGAVAGGAIGGAAGGGGGVVSATPSKSEAGTTYTPSQQSSTVKPPWLEKFFAEVPQDSIQSQQLGNARSGAVDRSKFFNELKDPEVRKLFATMLQAEVGGDISDSHQAFAEKVFNRATIENKSLKSLLKDRVYFQPYNDGNFKRAQKTLSSNPSLVDRNLSTIDKVAREGTDILKGATHNASGSVAEAVRGGRPHPTHKDFDSVKSSIVQIGKETYYYKTFEVERIKNLPRVKTDYPTGATSAATGILQQGRGETGATMPGGAPSLGPSGIPIDEQSLKQASKNRPTYMGGKIRIIGEEGELFSAEAGSGGRYLKDKGIYAEAVPYTVSKIGPLRQPGERLGPIFDRTRGPGKTRVIDIPNMEDAKLGRKRLGIQIHPAIAPKNVNGVRRLVSEGCIAVAPERYDEFEKAVEDFYNKNKGNVYFVNVPNPDGSHEWVITNKKPEGNIYTPEQAIDSQRKTGESLPEVSLPPGLNQGIVNHFKNLRPEDRIGFVQKLQKYGDGGIQRINELYDQHIASLPAGERKKAEKGIVETIKTEGGPKAFSNAEEEQSYYNNLFEKGSKYSGIRGGISQKKDSFKDQCGKGARGMAGALFSDPRFAEGLGADGTAGSLSTGNRYLQERGYNEPEPTTKEMAGDKKFLDSLPIGTVISSTAKGGAGHAQTKVGPNMWVSDTYQSSGVLTSAKYGNYVVHKPGQELIGKLDSRVISHSPTMEYAKNQGYSLSEAQQTKVGVQRLPVNPETQAFFEEAKDMRTLDFSKGDKYSGTVIHQTGFDTTQDSLDWMSGKPVNRGLQVKNPDYLGYSAVVSPDGKLIVTAKPETTTSHTKGYFDGYEKGTGPKINATHTSIGHTGKFDPKVQGKALLENGELASFFAERPGSLDHITSHSEIIRNRNSLDVSADRKRVKGFEGGAGEGTAFLNWIQENKKTIQQQIDSIQKSQPTATPEKTETAKGTAAPTTGDTKSQGLGPTTPTVPETAVTPEKVPELAQGGIIKPKQGENITAVNEQGEPVAYLNDREALRVEPASTMTTEERKEDITNFAADQSNPQSKQESRTEPPKASMRQEIQPNVRTQNMAFIDVIPAPSQESRAYQNAKGKKSRPGAGWNMEGLYHS